MQVGRRADFELPPMRGLSTMLGPVFEQMGSEVPLLTFDSKVHLLESFTNDEAAMSRDLGDLHRAIAGLLLTRLRAKVKYTVALKLIEKSLRQAAESSGVSTEELEDLSVEGYGLDEPGKKEIAFGVAVAELRLAVDGTVSVTWRNADGKLVKSAPQHVRKAFGKDVRALGSLAKDLEEAVPVTEWHSSELAEIRESNRPGKEAGFIVCGIRLSSPL